MKLFMRFLYIALIILALFSFYYIPKLTSLAETQKEGLHIFVWGDFFPEETFRKFEKETGIPLTINHYTSNEELILKLEKTNGKGYDLIFPSDYAIATLREKNLLKPLNRSKFSFWHRLEPCILNGSFDPGNRFSIPYFWEIYGLAIEKKKVFGNFHPTLSPLFDGKHQVVMMQDPVEILSLASHYLYGPKDSLSKEELNGIATLLKKQRAFIEAYTDHRIHYMIASENSPIAILRSSFYFKSFDTLEHIAFYPPQNGTFATIENVALSINSTHEKEAYAFINFIYRPEIMALQLDEGPLFPACKDALSFTTIPLPKAYYDLLEKLPEEKLYFINEKLIPSEKVRPLWVEICAYNPKKEAL